MLTPFRFFLIVGLSVSLRTGAQIQNYGYLPDILTNPAYTKNKANYWNIQLASGDVAPLKGLHKINIQFDHEYKAVCSFSSEAAYLEDIRNQVPEKQAEKQIRSWLSLPDSMIAPRFLLYFNKTAAPIGLEGVNNEPFGADATLIVKVLKEDPHPHDSFAYTSLQCTFLNKEGYFVARFNILASGSKERKIEERITECYGTAGKMLGKELTKLIRKLNDE
jgi:hypothetical protein